MILASNVLGEACIHADYPVRSSETHGMAQRGGSVESHVRIGARFSPLIPPGEADLLIAFELLEALRYRHYLKEGGETIANEQLIVPTSVFTQGLPVPRKEDVLKKLMEGPCSLIPALSIAEKAGSVLAQNIVMIGAASVHLPLPVASLLEGVKRWVPGKTLETNLKAFELGREAITGQRHGR